MTLRLRAAGVIGLDTEFYGVELDKKSPVGRSKIHVWSVAVRTGQRDPLGFDRARGWCLPVAALDHPGLRGILEDPLIRKCVHNQPVDHHALRNHGVQLRGAVNTLGLLRWHRPGLVNDPGRFALKPNMERLVHRSPITTFKELVTYERLEYRSTFRKVKRSFCFCGVDGCRKRSGIHVKTQYEDVIETQHERFVEDRYPLESITPGHPRWDLLVRYAAEDAVVALEFEEICRETPDPAPFPYGTRPAFNQEAEEAVIDMEAVGIPIDCGYAYAMADQAALDEEKELNFLHRWMIANAPVEGPMRRADDVDPIWSSPTKLVSLFDTLGFPRSPIWSKGKVKPPDVKMDQVALEWIAKNHPPAAQLVKHLIHLKRVRSGMKYLVKLRDCGGMVYPTCGPSGDDDNRAGAVTGRLGVKVELEAQQLPSKEDKDLYFIRKAIVAEAGWPR